MNYNPINLVCFPYAGGSNISFRPLIEHFNNKVSVKVVSYPGRGKRIQETLLHQLDQLVEDSWQQIQTYLASPYVLYGHSMGATIAYLIAHRIQQENRTPPTNLILSGRECPSIPCTEFEYLLPTAEFKNRLVEYGGISKEILENEEYFSFFEPIIRADMQAIETWQHTPKPTLSIPTAILTGLEEDLSEEEINGWQEEFSMPAQFKTFSGGHFFIYEQAKEVADYILQTILKI